METVEFLAKNFNGLTGMVGNLEDVIANRVPLFDLDASNASANISLSSRLSLAGSKLTFDDMDGVVGDSRIRGRIALDLGDEKSVDGGANCQ